MILYRLLRSRKVQDLKSEHGSFHICRQVLCQDKNLYRRTYPCTFRQDFLRPKALLLHMSNQHNHWHFLKLHRQVR